MGRFYLKTDFSQVLDKLSRMEQKMQSDIKKELLTESGEMIKRVMADFSPKDTGALASSIDYIFKNENSLIEVGVENPTGRVGVYNYYQEFGTRKMSRIVLPHTEMYVE